MARPGNNWEQIECETTAETGCHVTHVTDETGEHVILETDADDDAEQLQKVPQ
jgi:hypothetical protein